MITSTHGFGCDGDYHVLRHFCLRARVSSGREFVWPQRIPGHPRKSARVHCYCSLTRGTYHHGITEPPRLRSRFPDHLQSFLTSAHGKTRPWIRSPVSFTRHSNSSWIPIVRLIALRASRLYSHDSVNSQIHVQTRGITSLILPTTTEEARDKHLVARVLSPGLFQFTKLPKSKLF